MLVREFQVQDFYHDALLLLVTTTLRAYTFHKLGVYMVLFRIESPKLW